jgi:hypothetical protein
MSHSKASKLHARSNDAEEHPAKIRKTTGPRPTIAAIVASAGNTDTIPVADIPTLVTEGLSSVLIKGVQYLAHHILAPELRRIVKAFPFTVQILGAPVHIVYFGVPVPGPEPGSIRLLVLQGNYTCTSFTGAVDYCREHLLAQPEFADKTIARWSWKLKMCAFNESTEEWVLFSSLCNASSAASEGPKQPRKPKQPRNRPESIRTDFADNIPVFPVTSNLDMLNALGEYQFDFSAPVLPPAIPVEEDTFPFFAPDPQVPTDILDAEDCEFRFSWETEVPQPAASETAPLVPFYDLGDDPDIWDSLNSL